MEIEENYFSDHTAEKYTYHSCDSYPGEEYHHYEIFGHCFGIYINFSSKKFVPFHWGIDGIENYIQDYRDRDNLDWENMDKEINIFKIFFYFQALNMFFAEIESAKKKFNRMYYEH
jgi:hypothetical protein